MAVALQILASGFAAGAVYGLVAVGHSLVFRLTGVVHFAFGELIALGVFVTLLVAAGSGPVSQTSVGGGAVPARARRRPARHRRGERRRVLPRDRAVPRARLGDRLGRRVARGRVRGPDAARRLLRPARVRVPGPAAVPADRRRRLLARRRRDDPGALDLRRGRGARARRRSAARCCSARASAARSRRSRRTSTPRCSSACLWRASSGSRSRSPASGRGSRRSSPRRRRRSTSTPRRATGSTGCSPPRSCGSTRGARSRRASRSGSCRRRSRRRTSAARARARRTATSIPLALGLVLFAWRARAMAEAVE